MSQSEQTESLEQYRSSAGIESKTADISSDDHALKQKFGGSDEQKSFKFDPEIIAERISNWYDSDGATIREFLSNAETACIRRAKMELENEGLEVPDQITEVLEKAKEECGYEPLIEVTYNQKPGDTRLVIEDNGCGITTQEYQVLRNIGYSATHSQSGVGDGFGMGIMSFAQLTGTHGMMKFSTRSFPSVNREETAYSVAMYVTNLEFLSGEPEEYGTRFEFPDFSADAKDVNIAARVEEFSQGMVVPVLYRDFDSSGTETGKSDDFLPTRIEDAYADDSMTIIYEDEFFKAVMSPDSKEDGHGTTTYNISMPIRRNVDTWHDKFEARWSWDYRGKKEDGPIVHCPSDESLVGLVPKEDAKYEKLISEVQEKSVPMSQVPDDAISMPKPASSRDSFKSGNDGFWRYVTKKLKEEWADIARERFTDLDTWDDFLNMSKVEKAGLLRAYSEFGPDYKSDIEPDKITDTLDENLGVTLDEDLALKIHKSQSNVRVVRKGSDNAHKKSASSSKKIWKVIDEAPDGVYMGKTISQKKADIVWGLGETHLIRLEGNQTYSGFEEDWGWTKAKELPNRNLEEKLPNLDQDVIDQYENVNASDSNNTKSTSTNTGGDGRNPETYRGKVRVGCNNRKYFSTWKMGSLVDRLEDSEDFKAGSLYNCDKLIIHDSDESARSVGRSAKKSKKLAAMRVPNYVYEYLEGVNNVYEDISDVREEHAGAEITLSDGTQMDIREIPETDLLIIASSKTEQEFSDKKQEFAQVLGYDESRFDRITFINKKELYDAWKVNTEATVVKTGDASTNMEFNDYRYVSDGYTDFLEQHYLSEMDEDSDEYEAMFGYRYGHPESDNMATLIEIARDAGLVD